MEKTIEGIIISSQLGEFGHNHIIYGYIGLETPSGQKIVVKVDSYTLYETLEIGSHVFVETDTLGTTDIIVARRIDINMEPLVTLRSKAEAST
ncbi:hypothetical protein EU528_14710 [Candidatus Thorarchaeota archaeon]|nr:MAG: hypothetical protein EU528_14710 [Candidatus Thorarchaeota archaeon]